MRDVNVVVVGSHVTATQRLSVAPNLESLNLFDAESGDSLLAQ